MIVSLRVLYFSSFYYKGRLQRYNNKVVEQSNIPALTDYIEQCLHLSTWLFDYSDTAKKVLYQSEQIIISYDLSKAAFQLTELQAATKNTTIALNDLIDEMSTRAASDFMLHDYNFKPLFFRLLTQLTAFKTTHQAILS
jgi:hypothetical protein